MPTSSGQPRLLSPVLADAGQRLDRYLTAQLPDVSRARIQKLIEQGEVTVNGAAATSSLRLEGGEQISVRNDFYAPPLRAIAEEIPLDIVYEDGDLAIIDKPAGMTVHAGAGATDDARNRGTLVNALLHHFQSLSELGGELRPGIVHRLDRTTSGLILVAKNDVTHRKLAAAFAQREVHKTYIALVHGWVKPDQGTIAGPISRDRVHRTKMTTRRREGREAITHYFVQKRIESELGRFTLLEIKIETGRTHQIRVHLSGLGHAVVGDSLYGAPKHLGTHRTSQPTLQRNFLHAAALEFRHPTTGDRLRFSRPLPPELETFLQQIERIIEKK